MILWIRVNTCPVLSFHSVFDSHNSLVVPSFFRTATTSDEYEELENWNWRSITYSKGLQYRFLIHCINVLGQNYSQATQGGRLSDLIFISPTPSSSPENTSHFSSISCLTISFCLDNADRSILAKNFCWCSVVAFGTASVFSFRMMIDRCRCTGWLSFSQQCLIGLHLSSWFVWIEDTLMLFNCQWYYRVDVFCSSDDGVLILCYGWSCYCLEFGQKQSPRRVL